MKVTKIPQDESVFGRLIAALREARGALGDIANSNASELEMVEIARKALGEKNG